jgi:bifunctional DNase/RNase
MIPVKIKKISYYHPSRSYAVILEEIDGDRNLPVLVGAYEAQSIAMAMEFVEAPRPLTHDLIVNMINEIEGKISAIKITKVEDGIYFSSIDIDSKIFGNKKIDSRPSDALAIALRVHAPILVAADVMKEAIVWEEDSIMIEDEIKQSPEMEVLEQQLQKAIDKEQYEIAARIRDKINDIDH